MSAIPDLPATPDPLTLLPVAPAEPLMADVRAGSVKDMVNSVLFYGIIAIGILLPLGGGLYGWLTR